LYKPFGAIILAVMVVMCIFAPCTQKTVLNRLLENVHSREHEIDDLSKHNYGLNACVAERHEKIFGK
jgi:hypothetical protein